MKEFWYSAAAVLYWATSDRQTLALMLPERETTFWCIATKVSQPSSRE